MVNHSLKKILKEKDQYHDSFAGMAKSLCYTLSAFPGIKYKLRVIRNFFFVRDYFGRNRVFSYLPLFYFYGFALLFLNRLRR